MLTLDEIIAMRDRVIKGDLSIEQAKVLCWIDKKEGNRSWYTKDWKDRRAKMLNDHCEICGRDNDIMIMQHYSHPKKYTLYQTEIANEFTKKHLDSTPETTITDFTSHLLKEYEYHPIPLCPKCNARKPNKRIRKIPQFLCTDCGNEFEQTTNRSVSDMVSILYQNNEAPETRDKCFATKDEWSNNHSLLDVRYWFQRKKIEAANLDLIERKAFLLYLGDIIKYLSFVDTVTACKKCASYFDLYKLELCPICRLNYKGIDYPSCILCLPEGERKIVLEKIEFGRAMREIEKNLGID